MGQLESIVDKEREIKTQVTKYVPLKFQPPLTAPIDHWGQDKIKKIKKPGR